MSRKRFGQHFLRDEKIIDAIFAAINPRSGESFIEIGPGKGVLTDKLLASGAAVTAIEIDRDLVADLRHRYGDAVNIISADVLRVDWRQLLMPPVRVVGNLPYNISTPLLLRLAEMASAWTDAHVMLQKEVADRLCATPSDAHYGRLSVRTQLAFSAAKILAVGPSAFSPPPKVDSVVLRLLPQLPPLELSSVAESVLRAAFEKRRKTLKNALAAFTVDWQNAGIDGERRAQTLSPQEFLILAAAVSKDSSNQDKTQ